MEAAIKEAIATLYAVKTRLEINDYAGEESPYIQDCETAIELLEKAYAQLLDS